MLLHLKVFAVTAAALSAKVKIQVASLCLHGQLKGTPDHEDSMLAAGCFLAVHDGLFSYSQPCDTAGSITAFSFYFGLLIC